MHDGERNTYKFEKDGIKHTLVPLKEESRTQTRSSKALLFGGKEFLKQMEKEEVNYVVVYKPKVILMHIEIKYLPIEI